MELFKVFRKVEKVFIAHCDFLSTVLQQLSPVHFHIFLVVGIIIQHFLVMFSHIEPILTGN